MCVCPCMRACACVCVRACVCMCVRACVYIIYIKIKIILYNVLYNI